MITHDREFFYKYVSSHTAKAILRNGSVRWSSPRIFNDPFDVQVDLHLPFTEDEYVNAAMNQIIIHHAKGRSEPIKANNNTVILFNLLLDRMRSVVPGLSEVQLKGEFLPSLREGHARAIAQLPEVHKEIRDLLGDICVFCISEIPDNLLMWSHYSDSHKGAVIKFKCLPEKDTALCAATQVKYQQDMPVWASLDEWINSNFGGEPLSKRKYLDSITATKSNAWKYEKEWRVISSFRTPIEVQRGYADYSIYPKEIVELILGCRMSEIDRAEILALTASMYSHVSLFQAAVHSKRFELVFNLIK